MSETPAPPPDLLQLHAGHRLESSGEGRLAPLRRLLARLLAPLLDQQSAYNAANARLQSAAWERLEAAERRLADLRRDHDAARADIVGTVVERLDHGERTLRELQRRMVETRAEAQDARERQAALIGERLEELGSEQAAGLRALSADVIRHLEEAGAEVDRALRRLHRELGELRRQAAAAGPAGAAVAVAPGALGATAATVTATTRAANEDPAPAGDDGLDALHVALADAFRGERGAIRERHRVYLPHVRATKPVAGGAPILDLACGRGEWLELLATEALPARGVERSALLIEECRRRGLDVARGDVLAALAATADQSLGAVTAFHLAEHLPFPALVELIDHAHRVLAPGGLFVLETPNPANVQVAGHTFWLDPTHRQPLPSALLAFLVEARGFATVEVLPLHPWEDAVRIAPAGDELSRRFNDHFYGPRDYAVLARRD